MLELSQVKKDINEWIEKFLEVPNNDLNGWSPCPYARQARLAHMYDVRLGTDVYDDLKLLSESGLNHFSVVIYAYLPQQWHPRTFANLVDKANRDHLLDNDLISLEDHPRLFEVANNVCFNNGRYALTMTQSLSELNEKSSIIAKKGFYENWPAEYLDDLFRYRKDPRFS